MKYVIAYDLGTGGIKSSLFNQDGNSLCSSFIEYDTYYDNEIAGNSIPCCQEQNPLDWWNGVIASTKNLLEKANIDKGDIAAIGISGHSLGVVPVDISGNLLARRTPIWSDCRAYSQAETFFKQINSDEWYIRTGGGFPAEMYSIFKIMWYKDNAPDLYDKTYKFIGTKDYINLLLTGVTATDFSYASGSGVYDLSVRGYHIPYVNASGIDIEKLPKIVPSTSILGKLTKEAAELLGLSQSTAVVTGGVDNACMALGAACYNDGKSYTSLGTSAWIAVSDSKPIVNLKNKTYVFEHCVEGQYVSAVSIFSAGRSLKWVKDTLCKNIEDTSNAKGENVYRNMDILAEKSPVGAKKLYFNPSLSGGSPLDKSQNIRGSFVGLDLSHTQGDIIRATMEGIALNLRMALDILKQKSELQAQMLIVGGGANSDLWMQIFADCFNMEIMRTAIGQNAGSLGAAALALVGVGIWSDYSKIGAMHKNTDIKQPINQNVILYENMLETFKKIADFTSELM